MVNLFVVFILSSLPFAHSLSLRSLTDVSSTVIERVVDRPSIFVIFQKDCPACRKQIEDLACLQPLADVRLVGSFSTEEELRKEYRTFKTSRPGFYGGKSFRKKFNVNQRLTPQILIVGGGENILFRGLTSCAEIAKNLKVEKQ